MSTKPQILAWITCDSVYVDPATGKHTLLGIFSNLRAKEFPVVHPRMIWFLSFSDLTAGKHDLKITIGIPMSDESPRTIIEKEFESPYPVRPFRQYKGFGSKGVQTAFPKIWLG
jgi:hypothetical protein